MIVIKTNKVGKFSNLKFTHQVTEIVYHKIFFYQ